MSEVSDENSSITTHGAAVHLSDEERQMYHWHAVERKTQREIAALLGITQQAVSFRLQQIRKKIPPIDLDAVRQEMLAIYADSLRATAELMAMDGVPVTAGKDGDYVYDPETQKVARDYSGRIAAIKTRNDVTAHMRKLLGLDAAEKHEVAGAVRYELVGVDLDDLS